MCVFFVCFLIEEFFIDNAFLKLILPEACFYGACYRIRDLQNLVTCSNGEVELSANKFATFLKA